MVLIKGLIFIFALLRVLYIQVVTSQTELSSSTLYLKYIDAAQSLFTHNLDILYNSYSQRHRLCDTYMFALIYDLVWILAVEVCLTVLSQNS